MLRSLTAADGHSLRAYAVGDSPAPGLIVVQEIFGVNSHIREVCQGFAQEGFQVLSPLL
jgi:carboxymethylenebutenolidase